MKRQLPGTSRRIHEGRSTQLPPLHSNNISISHDISGKANLTGNNYLTKSNEGLETTADQDKNNMTNDELDL